VSVEFIIYCLHCSLGYLPQSWIPHISGFSAGFQIVQWSWGGFCFYRGRQPLGHNYTKDSDFKENIDQPDRQTSLLDIMAVALDLGLEVGICQLRLISLFDCEP